MADVAISASVGTRPGNRAKRAVTISGVDRHRGLGCRFRNQVRSFSTTVTTMRHRSMFTGRAAGWLFLHINGGMLALLTGPWQFWTGLRQRNLTIHRWTGRLVSSGRCHGRYRRGWLIRHNHLWLGLLGRNDGTGIGVAGYNYHGLRDHPKADWSHCTRNG